MIQLICKTVLLKKGESAMRLGIDDELELLYKKAELEGRRLLGIGGLLGTTDVVVLEHH